MSFLTHEDIDELSDVQLLVLADEMRYVEDVDDFNEQVTAEANLFRLENEIRYRGIKCPIIYGFSEPVRNYRPILNRRR